MKKYTLPILIFFLLGCRADFGTTSAGTFVVRNPSLFCFEQTNHRVRCFGEAAECTTAEAEDGFSVLFGCRAVYH
jgi:hypothetical protein